MCKEKLPIHTQCSAVKKRIQSCDRDNVDGTRDHYVK